MADFEVHLSLAGRTRRIGRARSNLARGRETVLFEYHEDWLACDDRFALAPDLPLTRGGFAPPAGLAIHGSLADSAPDSWGRRLMQRAERWQAQREGRAVRTLMESDYLLGVADETRLGALRFRRVGEEDFLARPRTGVPALVELGRLLQSTERILRDEETDDDRRVAFNILVSNVDDHLRNHGFLQHDRAGWTLSPAYDLNPVPADLKARVLTTSIDLEEATCSIDLLESAAGYFALAPGRAREMIAEVAAATRTWRKVAREVGAAAAEIDRMASAFEHDELRRALALS